MTKRHNSYVIYDGPSQIDGNRVVAIVTCVIRPSKNPKVGAMLPVYILTANMDPVTAIHSGADRSICGDCDLRGRIVDGRNVERPCYVLVWQDPLSVWRGWERGSCGDISDDMDAVSRLGSDRSIRLGAYGDPCAVPLLVWRAFLSESTMHTAYSHQWRDKRFTAYRDICMASVSSAVDLYAARNRGWRTYRVRSDNDQVVRGESICPASAETNYATTCEQCGSCAGLTKNHRDKVIIVHGAGAKHRRENHV